MNIWDHSRTISRCSSRWDFWSLLASPNRRWSFSSPRTSCLCLSDEAFGYWVETKFSYY